MYTLTRSTLGCSKWRSNKTAGEKKAEKHRYITRPALSRPRPALSHGYLGDSFDPRTKLGKGRVSARLGRVGVMEACFNILYCPRYQPMPYRSRKLVIIVSEFA
jgi:hypothetical protein